MSIILNENNIQSPFQYKISENSFELKIVSGGFLLNINNVQVKVFSGQRLFCADIGYAIDGAVEEMEFLIDSIKVYPVIVDELEDLQTVDVKDNEIYLIKNEIDFKSIVFFPPIDLNKKFDFIITTYSTTFSAFMFDEIAKKLNSLDINYPVKNYYENTDYKVNDIIKNNGYLYRVFKDFTSDDTDYYLTSNCNLLTPFKKLELNTDYKSNELIEYENNFLIVQKDFRYENKNGVLTNLNGLLKPLQDIIVWFDGIAKIYKNQIIIKDNFSYIVLEDIENPVWGNIQKKLNRFIKAENTFYDDTNSGFGNNTNNVQKAIEKLKSGKQDSLIPGNNINLNGSNISVIGGTNKEYITGNKYYINDLIIKEDKIYQINENFTASNWNTDISKCTLVSGGGSGEQVKAVDVSFDNSNAQLQKLVGYDYPKYKKTIANTINMVLSNGTSDYNASIVKQSDGSYRLKCNISNFNISGNFFEISIKGVNNLNNIYQRLSFLSQFFNIQTVYTDIQSLDYNNLTSDECVISNLNLNLKFVFIYSSYNKSLSLIIAKQDLTNITSGTYNITLNIQNRVLKQEDRNIFAFSDPFMSTQDIMDNYIFNLSQNNSSVKLTGSYTVKQGAGLAIGFYSPIIENYFNVSSSVEWKNTTGITSSSKKALKFSIYKNNNSGNERPLYLLFLMHQDETDLQVGEKITFNLTPDKNSTLNPIYQNVNNVQQMGEALADKVNTLTQKDTSLQSSITSLQQKDTNLQNQINNLKNYPNINQEINTGGTYQGKPVYKRVVLMDYTFLDDGKWHYLAIQGVTIADTLLRSDVWLVNSNNTLGGKLSISPNDIRNYIKLLKDSIQYQISTDSSYIDVSELKGIFGIFEYTKK